MKLGIMQRNYWTAAAVAKLRHKTQPALVQERKRGEGPPFVRDNGRILYPEDELFAWLDARLVNTNRAAEGHKRGRHVAAGR
jgi:hypothetical protein